MLDEGVLWSRSGLPATGSGPPVIMLSHSPDRSISCAPAGDGSGMASLVRDDETTGAGVSAGWSGNSTLISWTGGAAALGPAGVSNFAIAGCSAGFCGACVTAGMGAERCSYSLAAFVYFWLSVA